MYENFIQVRTGYELSAGRLLLSEPMMQDEGFRKSVIYLTHHMESESMGFILNKKAPAGLQAYIPGLERVEFPLYVGGPVAHDSLQFLHDLPELFGGTAIAGDIFWNGDFAKAFECIRTGMELQHHIRFFMGYSGWGDKQLEDELSQSAWLVAEAGNDLLFHTPDDALWESGIRSLGESFKTLLFVPERPDLN